MRPSSELNDDDIRRRLEFLLNEAKQPSPILDQIVDRALRQLGNYFWTNSRGSYVNRPCRSKAAHELSQIYPKDWYKNEKERNGQEASNDQKVESDHWEPISQLWEWMCQKDNLTVDDVRARILRWPIVVMTKTEHGKLKNWLEPKERYHGVISEFFVLSGFFVPGDEGGWEKVDLQGLMDLAELFAAS